MKKKFENTTNSEIIFNGKQEIEAIEIIHHHLKFVVTDMDTKKSLFSYISPQLINEYLQKTDVESIKISNNVTL